MYLFVNFNSSHSIEFQNNTIPTFTNDQQKVPTFIARSKRISMYRSLYVLLLFAASGLRSQVLPKEESLLHYRIIGFSFSSNQQNRNYKLEVARGFYTSEDSFKKNVVLTENTKSTRLIAEVPSFGTQYTWRVTPTDHKSGPGVLHHFKTGIIPFADTNATRLRIIHKAPKHEGAYVFLDGARTLYDMQGHPIWYLPNLNGKIGENGRVCDLRMTPQGTITFVIRDKEAYEISYDGQILWQGPNNSQPSRYVHYHHEFTRLNTGNYMILGTDPLLWKYKHSEGTQQGGYTFSHDFTGPGSRDTGFRPFPLGSLIEYNKKGDIVWQWNTAKYILESDLNFYPPQNGQYGFDVHTNAFFFDEKNKVIYLSFRNMSRVIKIKYPEGTVLNTYGEVYKSGFPGTGAGLFCGQHNCRISENGYLYLFDNNVCSKDSSLPKIVVMQEPATPAGPLKKVWEYECNVDGINAKKEPSSAFVSGGSVIEMQDGSFFVSMSSPYSNVFIVNRNKEILWSAVSEQWSPFRTEWEMPQSYRASIIPNRAELERLIWSTGN